ncbi:MAG: ion channel [Rhizobiaceae bacterium]|nr:ion channel [Rhizobiaceae bacterium]
MDEQIYYAIGISIVLVIVTTAIFYEILCIVLRIVSKYDPSPRPLMFFLVLTIFSAHTIAIWIYGTVYWALANLAGYEPLIGVARDDFFGYIYFSAATYSSLGIGDIFPQGAMQFITGVEVLNGLMLIGWSVMFTYFAVEKLWNFHSIEGLKSDKNEEK